jgi:hypothetical protein
MKALIMFIALGKISGLYTGYSRAVKKDAEDYNR